MALEKKTIRAVAFLSVKVAAVIAVVACAFMLVLAVRICRSTDMHPNLRDGDFVLVQRTHDVTFDDVILYEHDGQEYFGRVVAVAGEEVRIGGEDGLVVNGNVVYNSLPYPTEMPDGSDYEVTVGEGEVFVLGDHRTGARDSREFGCISKQDAVGRQIYLMRWRSF